MFMVRAGAKSRSSVCVWLVIGLGLGLELGLGLGLMLMFTLDHFQFTLIHDTTLMAESEEELKSLLMK